MKAQLETLIAVCALLIAAIAAGASAYQTYVINEQFSATVWPYLAFNTNNDTSALSLSVAVQNYGLGPAIVRSAAVTVDGKPMGPGTTGNATETAIHQAIQEAVATERRLHQHGMMHATTSSLTAGDVIPAGFSKELIRVQGPGIYQGVTALRPRVDISICYCSVLGRCWMRNLQDKEPEPKDVRVCPLPR